MATVTSLEEAPTLSNFIKGVQKEEAKSRRTTIKRGELKLGKEDTLRLGAGRKSYKLSGMAVRDLAHLADIPADYFAEKCDAELRALSFNHRIGRAAKPKDDEIVVETTGDTVHRAVTGSLLQAPRAPVLEVIRESIPARLKPDDVRVMTYTWNGSVDIAAIAKTLTSKPKKNDIIAYGLSLLVAPTGAVQVHGAAFRCWCDNGAVMKVCHGRKHRLKRPQPGSDKQDHFFRQVRHFADDAWSIWKDNARSIRRLVTSPIYHEQDEGLLARLTRSPFFLSRGVARRILQRVAVEEDRHRGGATMYDLWNAMTFVGTHDPDISDTLRYRVRASAGEIARKGSHTCKVCHQVVISDDKQQTTESKE